MAGSGACTEEALRLVGDGGRSQAAAMVTPGWGGRRLAGAVCPSWPPAWRRLWRRRFGVAPAGGEAWWPSGAGGSVRRDQGHLGPLRVFPWKEQAVVGLLRSTESWPAQGGLWATVASTGVAFQRADFSRGLSAAEVRRRVARWRLAAAAGCSHPRRPRVKRSRGA
nr:unnamed protein product [Digitaria exilis]